MKLVIIGSVAGGTSVGAKARRNNEDIDITIYEKDYDISYSGCGLPYYIGNDYISRKNITPRDELWFKNRFDIDIKTGNEVLSINTEKKVLSIKNLKTNEIFEDRYDKLVLATGAEVNIPKIIGRDSENVFFLKNVKSADAIKSYIEEKKPKKATIIGSGFIGLELLENLTNLNIETTIIEKENQIMPLLDEDVSIYLEKYLLKQNINIKLNEMLTEITNNGNQLKLKSGELIDTDLIIFCTGIKPYVELAKNSGIELGETGAIKVNNKMETNIKDIYAVGDCIETFNLITNKKVYIPLGSTANKTGRIAGDVITGGNLEFRGILGTSIFKVFDMAVAKTGLTEEEAENLGYDIDVIHNIKEDKSKYLKESTQIIIKAIADRKTEKLLGIQIIGEEGVDKRIDVFVTAISLGAKVSDLFHIDFAYAPPFSTTKDPVMYTGMIFENNFSRNVKTITAKKLLKNRNDFNVIDVRGKKDYDKGHIENAIHMPLKEIRENYKELPSDKALVVHCNKGVTGNAAQNLLINLGFDTVYNLSGGYKHFSVVKKLYK